MRYFLISKDQAMEVYDNQNDIPEWLHIYEDGTAYDPVDTAGPWDLEFFDPEIPGEFERQAAFFGAAIID